MKIPLKYIPRHLTRKDYIKQKRNITNTRKLYNKQIYKNRPKLKSYKNKKSSHVEKAKKLYKVNNITPSAALAKASKWSQNGLRRITKKGRGAYYSSGSRPNQTAQSWARARLASALTGGPACKVDYHILKDACKPSSKALKMCSRKTI